MENKLQKKDQEIDKLRRKIKETEEKYKKKVKEESEKRSREIKRNEETIDSLQKSLKEEERKRREAEILSEEKINENKVFLERIEEYKSKNEQLAESELNIKAELGKNKAKVIGLEDRFTTLQNNYSKLDDDFQKQLIKEKERYLSELDEQKSKFEHFQDETSKIIAELKNKVETQNDLINNKQAEINQLEVTNQKISIELNNKSEEIGKLNNTIKKLTNEQQEGSLKLIEYQQSLSKAEDGIVQNLPNLLKGEDQAIKKITELAGRTKSNSLIIFPDIEFLPKILPATQIQTKLKFRIMANIDINNPQHRDILQQYDLPNITFRNYEEKNIWGINRDREELIYAVTDKSNIPFGFKIDDPFQIEQFGSVFLAIWGKLRRDVRLM